MGIFNALEDAAGAAVEGAKEMLGLGEEKQESVAEIGVNLDEGAESAEVAQSFESPPPAETVKNYTIQAGDTLSKISQEFYGNSHDYMKIFEANRDHLSDPDKIRVGQELVIPN